MSLNAIFRHPSLYRTAVAIAFVADMRLYDSIYQERYMGLPAKKDPPGGWSPAVAVSPLLLLFGRRRSGCSIVYSHRFLSCRDASCLRA